MASSAHSPLNSILKSQFGLCDGDDFDSEPTSVLDLTQCISPPLQADAWVEKQQQTALWELTAWQQQQQLLLQHQENMLWEYQLSEEQQLWQEQQLQNLWLEQNEDDMQYLYENDQMMMHNYTCDEFSNSYQALDDHHQQLQQLHNINSNIVLQPIDDYKEAQLLDSWISNSLEIHPSVFPHAVALNPQTNAHQTGHHVSAFRDGKSTNERFLDGPHLPEFNDGPLQSVQDEVNDEDLNDAIFSQLREHLEVTSSEDFPVQRINNNDDPSFWISSQPAEDPLYQILHNHQQEQLPPPLVPQLPTHHDRPAAAARGTPDSSGWYERKVTAAADQKSVNGPSHHPSPGVEGMGISQARSLSSPVASRAAGGGGAGRRTQSGDVEEDSVSSIVSSVTSASSEGLLTPAAAGAPSISETSSSRWCGVSGSSGRVVTLAELASGGVKMGGVQLPNVGTQIPSVIRLAVETQTSSGMGGVRMVQLLLACAEAVACRDSRQANILLQQLQHMATPNGDAMQRITACFVEGLTARLAITGSQPFKFSSKPPGPRKPPSEVEKLEGFQLVYRVSPFLAFGHLAANAAILEAFEKEDKLHIVDLGMFHALQWPYLIHDLATRAGGPPRSLRITGFGLHSAQLKEAGEELVRIAKARNIPFEFRAVNEPLENMKRSMLELREGEALAVNSVLQLHCVVKESRGSLNAVLQTIHELSPKILTLVEQDASHNGPFFLGRFMEALHYYSAIFDSLDVILPRKCPHRLKMEQFHFAEEIKNIVSCEGPARVERHERVDQWRRKMSRAGFQPVPLKFLSHARAWLSHYNCDGYTLSEEKGCLVMGWKGKPIIAASSWK